jgi:hypothetical protein
MIGNHIFKRFKWNLSLEGFEGEETTEDKDVEPKEGTEPKVAATEPKVATESKVSTDPKVAETESKVGTEPKVVAEPKASATEPKVEPKIDTELKLSMDPKAESTNPLSRYDDEAEAPIDSSAETDKATMMTDLFESVNKQMDIIRTLKLSENMIPIKIDKSVPETLLILANLKLLINNGVYKNELDLKEIYDKYIGNKAVQLLASDINSLNMASLESVSKSETTYLSRTKSVVDGHQKIIDKILENKSKE